MSAPPVLTTATIDKNPNTPFYFPQNLSECVSKVLSGEYEYMSMPDEPPIRRVVDIGGNVGAFAAWVYKRYHGGVWIDSYEPHPACADLYERNAPPGAKVHRFAVSASSASSIKLHVGKDWGQNSLFTDNVSVLEGTSIDVPTLHPSLLPPCDLLKIDGEGIEPEVLKNYPFLDKTSVVMFEWHRQEDLFECERLCRRAGLLLIKSMMDRGRLGLQVWVRTKAAYDINKNAYEVKP